MKIKDFKDYLGKMLDDEGDFVGQIEKEAVRLAQSGGIDLESYENNFLAPKICLYVALLNMAEEYRPLSEYKEVANNLKNF
jgi:hypothetical protein